MLRGGILGKECGKEGRRGDGMVLMVVRKKETNGTFRFIILGNFGPRVKCVDDLNSCSFLPLVFR